MRVFLLTLTRGGLGPFRGLDAPFAPTPTVNALKRRNQACRTLAVPHSHRVQLFGRGLRGRCGDC